MKHSCIKIIVRCDLAGAECKGTILFKNCFIEHTYKKHTSVHIDKLSQAKALYKQHLDEMMREHYQHPEVYRNICIYVYINMYQILCHYNKDDSRSLRPKSTKTLYPKSSIAVTMSDKALPLTFLSPSSITGYYWSILS